MPNTNYRFDLTNKDYTLSSELDIKTPVLDSETKMVVEDTRTNPPYSNEVEIYSFRPDEIVIRTREYIVAGVE